MVGRPRSEQARRAVLDAVFALGAEQTPRALSMEAIARHAGVSKETIYRWWHSKTEVVLDALAERSLRTIAVPDEGSLRADLQVFLHATVSSADETTRHLLLVLAAEAASDPERAVLIRDRFLAVRRAALSQLLNRAITRGELEPRQAPVALDLIYGSLWYRLIFAVGDLDDAWANDVAQLVARAHREPKTKCRVPTRNNDNR
jgi:AcrR family transcriptional regulator